MPRTLPDCPCGGFYFEPSGSQISSSLLSAQHKCMSKGCNKRTWELSTSSGSVVIFLDQGDEHQAAVANKWVNEVLLVAWRHRKSRMESFHTIEWRSWLDNVFKPMFPECEVSEDYCVSYHDLPAAAQALLDKVFGKNLPPLYGNYLPLPLDLRGDVYPPKVPEQLVVYSWSSSGSVWELVDPNTSASMPVPRDPIVVASEDFFSKVWPAVEKNIGRSLPNRTEIKNQYGGVEPWYHFTLNNVSFIVGWRKRVINVDVEASLPLPTKAIRELAERDNTTYTAGNMWKSDSKEAKEINIHAWSKDTLIEYLTVLCTTVLEQT